ncbi:MAG: hypothetical protein KDA63_20450 [Planctomycetales bacterium]|nr:hypothetical protein [Planctomycetales bacterium]
MDFITDDLGINTDGANTVLMNSVDRTHLIHSRAKRALSTNKKEIFRITPAGDHSGPPLRGTAARGGVDPVSYPLSVNHIPKWAKRPPWRLGQSGSI